MPVHQLFGLGDWTPAATYFVGGGAITASLALAADWRFGSSGQRRVIAGFAGCWAIVAVTAFLAALDWQLATAAACWSLLSLLALVPQYAWFTRAVRWGLRPAVVWAVVLAASVQGAIAIPWFAHSPPQELTGVDESYYFYRELTGIVAVTDQGREIPLSAYDVTPSFNDTEPKLLGQQPYAAQLIRLFPPNPETNCHGWVFTGGRHAIPSQHIQGLLNDNHYTPIDSPVPGDIVVYRSAGETILHTGLVKWVDERGAVFVESKWGPLGVYLHAVESQPYGPDFTYYRTSRPNHLVTIQSQSQAEAETSFVHRIPASIPGNAQTAAEETPLSAGMSHPQPLVHAKGEDRT